MQLSGFMMNTATKLFTVYEKRGADAPFFYKVFPSRRESYPQKRQKKDKKYIIDYRFSIFSLNI